jgi:hypothetical protein
MLTEFKEDENIPGNVEVKVAERLMVSDYG